MKRYRITEQQNIIVAYYVEADDEAMARGHVTMLGAQEYDDWLSCEGAEILVVEEMEEEKDRI